MKKTLTFLLILLLYSGCAFVPREVDISRIEPRIIYPRESFGAKETIEFVTFIDKRPNKEKLGVARNKLMMVTTSIFFKGNLQAAVEKIVKQNFAAHGIGDGTSPYTLKGSIVEAHTDAWGPDHIFVQIQISLTMIDTRDNTPVFHKVLKGHEITPVTQLSNLAWEDAFIGAINQVSDQVQLIASETSMFLKNSERPANIASKISTGTGFCVSPDGHLITAYHIVKDATKIRVKFVGQDWLPAELQKYSVSNDVAVLKINQSTTNYLSFADFGKVKQGQKVFTLGYPVVGILGEEAKYTEGAINSLSGIMGEDSLIQISVPVQPGNSGGPLVTSSGDIIGMITSTAAVLSFFQQTGTLPQNINWAIKADYITPLLPKDNVKKQDFKSNKVDADPIIIVKKSVCFVEAK